MKHFVSHSGTRLDLINYLHNKYTKLSKSFGTDRLNPTRVFGPVQNERKQTKRNFLISKQFCLELFFIVMYIIFRGTSGTAGTYRIVFSLTFEVGQCHFYQYHCGMNTKIHRKLDPEEGEEYEEE